MESGREKYYKDVEESLQMLFAAEQTAVVAAYKKGGADAAEKAIKQKEMTLLLTKVYVEVIEAFGSSLMDQFKKDAGNDLETKAPKIPLETVFKVFDKLVQKFISSTVAKKVVGIGTTTKLKLRGVIKAGEALGESIDQIAARIDKLYLDQIIPNRSVVIARTEVIGASNAGNSLAADQTGLKLNKSWLATRDDRTRDTHNAIDGETVRKDKPYSNGLMFPGDPIGEAKEIIQCRCTETYKVIK